MVGGIAIAILFIIVVAAVCSGDDGTPAKRNAPSQRRSSNAYRSCSYSECPSCGAPYFDGYCEECGFPDVNQGWLGEEF